ncbi:hypothetical protein F4819DRAFT_482465 [Hypoxylon fuscum]|nr:hypothetical protein F4819DRAFT_482465 [Hypoxylon fuscum]
MAAWGRGPATEAPRFRLAFRVVSDGLETARAQALNAAGAHAHGGAFPRFAHLPPELRLKIWEYMLAPRVVAAACLDAEAPPPEEEPEEPWTSFPDLRDGDGGPEPRRTPVLLHTCREARALAQSRYALAFRWTVPMVLLGGGGRGAWSAERTWFDYARDALYLLGELEPCDSYGFNSPMAYFLDREEARRVRRLAVAFAALRYGEAAPQHIFGALFHVVDRFPGVLGEHGRVVVAVTPRDELTHALMGGEGPLVKSKDGDVKEEVGKSQSRIQGSDEVNVVQRTWRDWYRGSIVTSSLANVQFELVRELELPQYIAGSVASTTADSRNTKAQTQAQTQTQHGIQTA